MWREPWAETRVLPKSHNDPLLSANLVTTAAWGGILGGAVSNSGFAAEHLAERQH